MPDVIAFTNSIIHPQGSVSGDLFDAHLPQLTRDNISTVGNTILSNPVTHIALCEKLLGRIGETVIRLIREQTDPFSVFGFSTLAYGDTVQRIFVHLPEMKPFTGTNPSEMLDQEDFEIEVEYMKVDRKFFYKRTIAYDQLKEAFLNPKALEAFVRGIIQGMVIKYRWDIYIMTAQALRQAFEKQINMPDLGNCIVIDPAVAKYDNTNKVYVDWAATGAKSLLKTLKSVVPSLGYTHFVSYEHGSETITIPALTASEDAVFGLEIDPMIEMDVDALAVLFHLDKAELPSRIIRLQNNCFGAITVGAKTYHIAGFVMDKNLVDRRVTLEREESFLNKQTLSLNVWKHVWGYMAVSYFGDLMPILVECE